MNSRRVFLTTVGAGVSSALASAAAVAAPARDSAGDASLRVARLEAEQALRRLHQAFEQALDQGRYDDVIAMFADEAEVVFNGDVFVNRGQGLRRLFGERFAAGRTGRRIEPAPGFELTAEQQQDRVDVAADLASATAVFPYSIQVGRPIETESSLASMARLQGEGMQTWWEGGIYRARYRQAAASGRWLISRLEYQTLSRADWRPGRSYAQRLQIQNSFRGEHS